MVLMLLDLNSASKGFEVATDHQLPLVFEGPLALLTVEEIYDRASVDLFHRLKEDRRIERKPTGIHSQSLGEYFSMWANTAPDGGLVVIGMEDGGAVGDARSCHRRSLIVSKKQAWSTAQTLVLTASGSRLDRTITCSCSACTTARIKL